MRMRENMEGLCEGGRGKNLIFQGGDERWYNGTAQTGLS